MAEKDIRTMSQYNGVDTRQAFTTNDKFAGYRSREDKTMISGNYMIWPSQNVLIDITGRLKNRGGMSLYGSANAVITPIYGYYDWEEHKNGIINLRAYSGNLQFDSAGTWTTIKTGLGTEHIRFTNYWNDTEKINELIFVDGSSYVYNWNGASATFASASNSAGIINNRGIVANTSNTGSGYAIGDVLTVVQAGGSGGTVKVETISQGAIATWAYGNAGRNYKVDDIIQFPFTTGYSGQPTSPASFKVNTVDGNGAVTSMTMLSSGVGYVAGPTVYQSSGGHGTGGFQIQVNSISTSVTSVSLVTGGSGYTVATDLATTYGGAGTGAKVDITTILTNSITLQGTQTWADLGFYLYGNKQIVINGITYSYTNGETTTTIAGILPDPVAASIPVGTLISQAVVTNSTITGITSTAFMVPAYKFDGVSNLDNQIYYGSESSNVIYISKQNNFVDCSFTAPVRVVGEGASRTLRSKWSGFAVQEDTMYISGGKSQWYTIDKQISSDNTYEAFNVKPLKTAAKQATISQETITHDRDSIVMLTNETRLVTLGRTENILGTPMMTEYSYPIAKDFNLYDFTDASVKFWKSYIVVTIPKESKWYIFNQTDPSNMFWEAPQTGSFSGFMEDGSGNLYAHSYNTPETYKLFDGGSDNGHSILSRAKFAYTSYGNRSLSDYFNEYWLEGYISPNTTLNVYYNLDLDGCATRLEGSLDGNDQRVVCLYKDKASLGKSPLGKNPLGSQTTFADPDPLPPYFNADLVSPRKDFWKFSPEFETYGVDLNWQLISFGPLVTSTMLGNSSIKINLS